MGLLSCASSSNSTTVENLTHNSIDDRIELVSKAESLIGAKYKYGSSGPKSFDCSGFASHIYGSIGIRISGSAETISKSSGSIDLKSALPGDLIFFKKKGKVFHVSIIDSMSQGQLWVIHSTTSRGVIREDILASSYWREKIYKVLSLDSFKK
jgi:probable lipoprotein NlpC